MPDIAYGGFVISEHAIHRAEERAVAFHHLLGTLDCPRETRPHPSIPGRTDYVGSDFWLVIDDESRRVVTIMFPGANKYNEAEESVRRMAMRSPVPAVETRTPPSGMRVPKKRKAEPYVAPVASRHPLDDASPGARAAFDAALKKFKLTYRDINITKVTKTRVEWEPKPGVRICQTEHLVGPTSER